MNFQQNYEEQIKFIANRFYLDEEEIFHHYLVRPERNKVLSFIEQIESNYSLKSQVFKKTFIDLCMKEAKEYIEASINAGLGRDYYMNLPIGEEIKIIENPNCIFVPYRSYVVNYNYVLEFETIKYFKSACEFLIFGQFFISLEEYILDDICIRECSPSLIIKFPDMLNSLCKNFVIDRDFLNDLFLEKVAIYVLNQYKSLLCEILDIEESHEETLISIPEINKHQPAFINQLIDKGVLLQDGKTVTSSLLNVLEVLKTIINIELISGEFVTSYFLQRKGQKYTLSTANETLRRVREPLN